MSGEQIIAAFLEAMVINVAVVPPLPNSQTCGESHEPDDIIPWARFSHRPEVDHHSLRLLYLSMMLDLNKQIPFSGK